MQEYASLLQQALAEEIQATRLYIALLALSPPDNVSQILEIVKDETDHCAIISDLLIKAQTGIEGTVEEQVPGVD